MRLAGLGIALTEVGEEEDALRWGESIRRRSGRGRETRAGWRKRERYVEAAAVSWKVGSRAGGKRGEEKIKKESQAESGATARKRSTERKDGRGSRARISGAGFSEREKKYRTSQISCLRTEGRENIGAGLFVRSELKRD